MKTVSMMVMVVLFARREHRKLFLIVWQRGVSIRGEGEEGKRGVLTDQVVEHGMPDHSPLRGCLDVGVSCS